MEKDHSEEVFLVAVVEMAAGHVEAGQEYEDAMVQLMQRHGGSVERRMRSSDSQTEVHLIRFRSREGYESAVSARERLACRDKLGDAAPTTRVIEGYPVDNGARRSTSRQRMSAPVHCLSRCEGTGGVKPLTDSGRSEIKRTMREKILHTSQHPTITFQSTSVSGSPEALTIDGDLTIIGTTRPATATGTVSEDGDVRARTTVVQSDWGSSRTPSSSARSSWPTK